LAARANATAWIGSTEAMKRIAIAVVPALLATVLIGACTDEGPHRSPRCQRFVDEDGAARTAWREAIDSDAPGVEVDRLQREFLDKHEAMFSSGCLVS
jgi:hypothetical protein